MTRLINNYNEEKLLKTLFNVQKFESTLKYNLYNSFSIDDLYLIISYYINNNLLNKTIRAIDFAIELYPFDTNLYIKKADALLSYIKTKRDVYIHIVEESLDKAEIYDPDDYRIYLLRAELYECIQMPERALKELSRALKLTNNKDIVYLNIANIYYKTNNYDKAISFTKGALSYNPKSADAPIMLQEIYLQAGKINKAKIFLEKFVENNNPYSSSAWFALGYSYAYMNEHDKAIICYDYALVINEKYFEAKLYKISSLIKVNKNDEAHEILQSLDTYLNVIDNYELCLIADHYISINCMKEARKYYKKVLSNNKNDSVALFGISLTYMDDNYIRALKYLRQACISDPNNMHYLLLLAKTESELGNKNEAKNIYKKLIVDDAYNKEVWISYIEFLYSEDQTHSTIAHLISLIEHAIDKINNCAKLYYILARLLFIEEKYDEAEANLQKGVSIDPTYINTFFEKLPLNILQDTYLNGLLNKMIKTVIEYSKTI